MTMQLIAKGLDGTSAAAFFVPPVVGNLEYYNFFGDNAGKTGRNLAVGKPVSTIVGTPVVNPGYVTLLGNVNYLITGLLDQGEVTLVIVARPTPGDGAKFRYLIGNFNGSSGTAGGSNLYLDNSAVPKPTVGAARNASGTDAFQANAIAGETDTSGWAFYMARIGAGFNRVDDKTRGLSGTGSVTNPRSTPNGLPYRIGDDTTGVSTGAVDIAFAGIYSRCISDAEGTTLYTANKQTLANKSIPILI